MATLKSIKNKYLTASDGTTLGVTANTENVSLLAFKVATADSLSKFNLVDGFSDDYQDSTGVSSGDSTNETRDASNYFSGGVAGDATGGTITTYTDSGNDYKIHSFTSVGNTNFVVPGAGSADLLIVGGGGNGASADGNGAGGGGGGGGMRALSGESLTAQTYVVAVGDGGGDTGDDSSVAGFTAAGGGAGSGNPGGSTQYPGGSGGGGGGSGVQGGGSGNTPSTSPSQGNDGGSGSNGGGGPPCPNMSGGGGGGAGGSGGNASTAGTGSPTNGGSGGAGATNAYRTGSNVTYAGGGGGGGFGSGGSGGSGGGGVGGARNSVNQDGTDGLGGGGGGNGHGSNTGSGGSGIVVIRYIEGAFVSFDDMTLQSDAYTAQAAPTTTRIIMDEYTSTGSSTLNTDIKAYASRDGGTSFTQITLASQGTIETNHRLLSGSVDVSGQPSGTSMKYKITTHNQSASKVTRVYGTSMAWA